MVIYLDIVKDFVCRQCGACCQNNWLVTVDEQGYRRNKELFLSAGREAEFLQAFIPLAEADYGEYAQIAKRPEGGCWFLTAENLCRLQQLAGHEHLDTVCQWFPRYPMDTERGIELSLSFSCPAALQLASREEPLRIVRSENSPIAMTPLDFVTYVYPSQQQENSALRYYFEIEGHLIDVLQTRQLPLTDRLAMVKQSVERLERLSDSETIGRDISHFFGTNYDRIDAATATGASEAGRPVHWLIENYFVNFIFRKNLYSRGFANTLRQFEVMRNRLDKYLLEPDGAEADTAEAAKIIMQLELEYNHNSRKNGNVKQGRSE